MFVRKLIIAGTLIAAGLAAARGAEEAKPAAPPPGGFAARVEAKLGAPLSAAQKAGIADAAREATATIKAAQETFVQAVATAVRLSEADIRPMMPTIGQPDPAFDKHMIPKLETKLDRPLTEGERTAIRAADQAKKAVVKPAQERLAAAVAKITGMSAEAVQGLLPRIGL